MAYTGASRAFLFPYFGVEVCTIMILGPCGCWDNYDMHGFQLLCSRISFRVLAWNILNMSALKCYIHFAGFDWCSGSSLVYVGSRSTQAKDCMTQNKVDHPCNTNFGDVNRIWHMAPI